MLNNPRAVNALGFLACAGLMAYALFAQHVLGLEPCPLCVFQRVAVIGLGTVFALAALQGPGLAGRRLYAVLVVISAAAGSGVAGRHLWLQSLPPERVPACGPGLDYMLESFPSAGVAADGAIRFRGMRAGSTGSFLGLAMPAWVLICVLGLGLMGVWNNWRRP